MVAARITSLDHREERFPFLDNICSELRAVAFADVLCCVDGSRWDEQNVAGLEGYRRLALERVFPRAFEDIDDLFARMRVPRSRRARRELDAHLDNLASGDAEIVALEFDATCTHLLGVG